jgi:hypothetical protein
VAVLGIAFDILDGPAQRHWAKGTEQVASYLRNLSD